MKTATTNTTTMKTTTTKIAMATAAKTGRKHTHEPAVGTVKQRLEDGNKKQKKGGRKII